MTPGQKRIAIAEACGWTPSPDGRYTQDPAGLRGPLYRVQDLPDYLSDLNAMHEAEKVLTVKQMSHYSLIGLKGSISAAVHSTAAQRAEAFLKTIGKWEDET